MNEKNVFIMQHLSNDFALLLHHFHRHHHHHHSYTTNGTGQNRKETLGSLHKKKGLEKVVSAFISIR
jgi:hypothetical protein